VEATDTAKLLAKLPTDLAAALHDEGFASLLPIVRSGGPVDVDVAVVALQVATSVVTFAQGPETMHYLAAALTKWRRSHKTSGVKLTVSAKGPQGRVDLDLTDNVSATDIEAVLRLVGSDHD
jgi:hypothetical protein